MKHLALLLMLCSLVVAQDAPPEEKPAASPEKKPEAKKEETPAEPLTPAEGNPVIVMKTSMGDVELELFPKETPETVASFLGLAEGTREFTDPKTNEKVKRHYFDGLTFHRVIDDFMIQGGCPMGNGMGSPGYQFANEINGKALGLDKKTVFTNGRPTPGLPFSQQEFARGAVLPALEELKIDPTNRAEIEKREAEIVKILEKMTWEQALKNVGFQFDESRPSHAPEYGCLAMANAGPRTNGSQFFIITNKKGTPALAGKHTVFGRVISGMDVVERIAKVKVGANSKPVEEVTIISVRRKEGAAAAGDEKTEEKSEDEAAEPEGEPEDDGTEPDGDEPEDPAEPESPERS